MATTPHTIATRRGQRRPFGAWRSRPPGAPGGAGWNHLGDAGDLLSFGDLPVSTPFHFETRLRRPWNATALLHSAPVRSYLRKHDVVLSALVGIRLSSRQRGRLALAPDQP